MTLRVAVLLWRTKGNGSGLSKYTRGEYINPNKTGIGARFGATKPLGKEGLLI